jgi:hypothetical protein
MKQTLDFDVGFLELFLAELPALKESHAQVPGFYFGCARQEHRVPFRGAGLFRSIDGDEFTLLRQLDREAVVGVLVEPPQIGRLFDFDREGSFVVEVSEGATLFSVSEQLALSGENLCYVNGDILSYCEAKRLDRTKFRCSNLIRGLRGTRAAAYKEHLPNTRFALLTTGLLFQEFKMAELDAQVYYKLVPAGGLEVHYKPIRIAFRGETLRPFAPIALSAVQTLTGDTQVFWKPHTRVTLPPFQFDVSYPVVDPDVYDVEVDTRTRGRVRHRIEGRTWTYTAEERATDGFGGREAVPVRIYHVSSRVGRGDPLTSVLPTF